MTSSASNDDIELAMKSFETGISRLLDKKGSVAATSNDDGKKQKRQIKLLCNHMQYLLEELSKKRQSLQALIRWFQNEWNTRLLTALSLASQQQEQQQQQIVILRILQHTLEVFIRCQDGLVLMTSGECRHSFDKKAAKKTTQFQSKLSLLETRNDGYTCLYKADAIYSGFGWDEYANETIGLNKRLQSLLKRMCPKTKSPWDWLEGKSYTQLLDNLLDDHERTTRELQNDIQTLKRKITSDIKGVLKCTNFNFITQDKMERISLTYGIHKQSIRLERRANFSFGNDTNTSVLPNERRSPNDWKTSYSIQLPTTTPASNSNKNIINKPTATTKKRRRLTIEDSDDDDDDVAAKKDSRSSSSSSSSSSSTKPQTKVSNQRKQQKPFPPSKRQKEAGGNGGEEESGGGGGLVIKISKVSQKEEKEDSVVTIKNQMGVNSNRLEVSREIFEKETQQQQQQQQHQQQQQIQEQNERHLSSCKAILQRTQYRQVVDVNEVWDARECLRQAYMEMGNDYLSRTRTTTTSSTTHPNTASTSSSNTCTPTTTEYFEKAMECYQHAKKLIGEQQKSHQQNNNNDTASTNNNNKSRNRNHDNNIESKSIERNLLFLLARSYINIGIVLIEWGMMTNKTNKKKITQGIQEFMFVQSIAEKLRNQAQSDRQRILSSKNNQSSTSSSSSSNHQQYWIEATLDVIRANQIESLACRWIGIAMWPSSASSSSNSSNQQQQKQQQNYQGAIDMLQKASKLWYCAILHEIQHQQQHRGRYYHYSEELLQEVLTGAAECFYAISTLTDLGCLAMEKLNSLNLRCSSSSNNNYKVMGDKLLSAVTNGLHRHAEIRNELDAMMNDKNNPSFENIIQSFLKEEDIGSSKEIRVQIHSIKSWWEEQISKKKNTDSKGGGFFGTQTVASRTQQLQHLQRSDVFPSFGSSVLPALSGEEPAVMIILGKEKPRFSGRRSTKATSSSGAIIYHRNNTTGLSSGMDVDANNNTDGFREPVNFRKWGDELLLSSSKQSHQKSSSSETNTTTTTTSSSLVYPSVAPEMPPEIREYLEQHQQKRAESATVATVANDSVASACY